MFLWLYKENAMQKAVRKCTAEDDSSDEGDTPPKKRVKINCDELIGGLKSVLPEIGRKLAYNDKWNNGPGKEAVKALIDGVLRSKLDSCDDLDWYVYVCVYLLLHVSCRDQRGWKI